MGLRRESEVAPFFYVEAPTGTTRTDESEPRVGIPFTGTKRTVLIQDVVSTLGTRQPAADQSPKVFRQAFIYLVSAGRGIVDSEVQKVDRFRRAWTTFFRDATSGRGTAETRLRPGS
jgi:hypothetical protein